MADIRTSHEKSRGCGYRKPGGLYLFMEATYFEPCGFFPRPIEACGCCGLKLNVVRAMAMRPVRAIFKDIRKEHMDGTPAVCCSRLEEEYEGKTLCCGFWHQTQDEDEFLVDFVGASYYPTPEHFIKEARVQGISRRINGVPEGFVLGETTIVLGHPKAYDGEPGFFAAYKPERIEYIVKGDESEDDLQKMVERGFELVKVYELQDEQSTMFEFPDSNVCDTLQKHSLDSLRNTLMEKFPHEYDLVSKILEPAIDKSSTRGLAKKIYGYLTKDLGRPTSTAGLFKRYAEMRIAKHKSELKRQ